MLTKKNIKVKVFLRKGIFIRCKETMEKELKQYLVLDKNPCVNRLKYIVGILES